MLELLKDWFDRVRKVRTFPVIIVYIVLICSLVTRIFYLQIANKEEITSSSNISTEKQHWIKGTRGNIYDCNGVKLAYNETAYSVVMENVDGMDDETKNEIIIKLLELLKKYNCDIDVDFEIKQNKQGKLYFDAKDNALLSFKREVYGQKSIKELTKEQLEATASDVFEYLVKQFKLNIEDKKNDNKETEETEETEVKFEDTLKYSYEDTLQIVAIRYQLFLNRFQKYLNVTIASNIDDQTRVAIEENKAELTGVNVENDYYRKYSMPYYFSHVLGYTGVVNDTEIEKITNKTVTSKNQLNVYSKAGYTMEDQIGKTGIEKEYEDVLHGNCGSEKLHVNKTGRVMEISGLVAASSGNDVYLTIDSKLQEVCYKMLEKELSNILLDKIRNTNYAGSKSDSLVIPIYDVYFALLDNNVIDIESMNRKKASTTEKNVYTKISSKYKSALKELKTILDVNNKTPLRSLSKENQEYIDYIYEYLKDLGVLLPNKMNTEDKMYIAYRDESKRTISLSQYVQYCIESGWVDTSVLDIGDEYYSSTEIYEKIIEYLFDNLKDDEGFYKKICYYLVESSHAITGRELCMILYDQKVIKYDQTKYDQLNSGKIGAYDFIRQKIKKLEITPAQLALDPCSGSIVITDPNNGDVKACVSYPGYDINRFANKVNSEYYYKVLKDKSEPMIFRVVQERNAPGSTYKPLVAIAALDSGTISLGERISCRGVFTKTEIKHKCWYLPGHGSLDVSGGIANSCNVFFYTVGWKMSDYSTNPKKGLALIKKYAEMFGFGEKSGISSSELSPQIAYEQAESDPVTAAIGQSTNAYAPAQISRYATTLANQSNCYNLTTVDYIADKKGNVIEQKDATILNKVSFSTSIWNAVYKGMYNVVNGPNSSIDQYFTDLKKRGVDVAGKTGTAQVTQSRPNIGLFISFAPYNKSLEKRICTTVVIPYGYTSANAARVASDIYEYYFATTDKKKEEVLSKILNSEEVFSVSSARTD